MRKRAFRESQQRGQWTIIGLIVAMAIIVIMSAYLYPRYMAPGGVDGSVQSPEQDAQDVECGSYYQQIGDAIVSFRDERGHLPRSLRALRGEGVTKDMIDDSFCRFVYDPQTGMLGDRDVPLPSSTTAASAPQQNTSAGTPGYNGVATTTAAPGTSAPTGVLSPDAAPNTDIYSKAAHAGQGGDWNGADGDGGGGGHRDGAGAGSGSGSDPISTVINN